MSEQEQVTDKLSLLVKAKRFSEREQVTFQQDDNGGRCVPAIQKNALSWIFIVLAHGNNIML